MSKVTYVPFNPNVVPTGEEVYDNFYSLEEGIATSSLAVINGFLDGSNLESISNRELDYNYLQKNSVSGGGMVGGTANLDYFSSQATASDLAPAIDGTLSRIQNPETAKAGNFIAIPGGSVQFYLPYKAFVLLTWQVTWTNDSDDTAKESHVRLFIDGERAGPSGNKQNACNVRRVRRTMFAANSAHGGGDVWPFGIQILTVRRFSKIRPIRQRAKEILLRLKTNALVPSMEPRIPRRSPR